ncbi:DUF3103 family protein [Myxococcus llanfairpwllgwyngyllgogerychwyrndrobwllllantysiliogogogochensis]|uniref:DUF3103 family protein n=1 Tax=Myxococcus llanfairpwllgwyngyllgogerychwyrndrobwllllantysiliogogogochensis TaxID=2590453 RepID=A0A540WSV3_9BACT|nr:DUF3103 family protein [Myxococcus llanfairpwllgwyngyllgogerychwyrndrobwllllantysiliogogogochensis]
MKRIGMVVALLVCLSEASQAQAAALNSAASRERISVSLAADKRELALTLAKQDSVLRRDLASRLSGEHLAVDLKQWLSTVSAPSSVTAVAGRADLTIRQRKGLERELDSLLQLRLASASMLPALKRGVEPLYAYEPDGNDSQWQFIEAFDRLGGVHHLDVHRMPEQPVLVVDIDSRRDLAAGIKLMRERLVALGQRPMPLQPVSAAATSTPVTMLDRIYLNDDEEPWISGDAEVYAIVNGVDPSRDEPQLDIVDMPYLDKDGRTYSPNQVLIFWDRYRWAAANVVLMEHDDNTNYQELVSHLFTIASQILTALGHPEISALVALGSGLVDRMPSEWFSNDDDYVDSYYTVEKNHFYTNHGGARGNAVVSLRPYEIAGQ